MWSPVGVDGSGILNPLGQAAVQAVVRDSVGPQVELADAIEKSKIAAASESAYEQAKVAADTATNGVLVLSDPLESAAEFILNFGSVVEESASAYSGTKVVRFPWENNSTQAGKPIYIYKRTPFSAVAGRKYRLRVMARTTGAIAADAGMNFIIAKPNGTNTPVYVAATPGTLMTSIGVTSNWTLFQQDWTAPETTDYIFGPRAYRLTSDLQVDGPLEARDASVLSDKTAELAAAKTKFEADRDAAVAAWRILLPAGALQTSSGDEIVRTVSLTRAEYQAIADPDPNVLYLVTT